MSSRRRHTRCALVTGVQTCALPIFADEVVVDWPHRHLASIGGSLGPRDAVCVLTHDAKFDVPAIRAALQTDVGYLGAMGSRRTTEQRTARLRDDGGSDAHLARITRPEERRVGKEGVSPGRFRGSP